MSFNLDDANVGGQLKIGTGIFPAIGEGITRVNGSAGIEGPVVTGNPMTFPNPYATLNISPLTNGDSPKPFTPGALTVFPGGAGGQKNPYSLAVAGNTYVFGELNVQGHIVAALDLNAQKEVWGFGGVEKLSRKKDKPFDMPHPNKKGWRLRHVCIEGPEIAVYCRGKVPSDGVINLPSFWDGLVNPEDMSISLTPIGSWQELFVKEVRWGKQVIVRNNAGGPINADYYIVARRLDDDLVVEYEGNTTDDYPGGNDGYSFNFEDTYVKGLIKEMVHEKLKEVND